MEQHELAFLTLLKEAMWQGHPSEAGKERLRQAGAEPVMRLAFPHNLVPLIGSMVLEAVPEDPGYQQLRQQVRGTAVRQAMATGEFLTLTEAFQREEIPFLVIKGAFCRSLYPNPALRPSSDEDILVPEGEMARAEAMLQSMGYTRGKEGEEDAVHSWYGKTLYVELHRQLMPEPTLRGVDVQSRFFGCFDRNMKFTFDDRSLATLGANDNLLFLVLHYYKHFLAGGVGIRQLCDIVLFADRYRAELNQDTIWQDLRQFKLEVFFQNLLDIGVQYLGLDPEILPVPRELGTADSGELLQDILEAGVFGGSTMERRHSGNITIQAAKSGKEKNILTAMFPPPASIQGRYPYLRRHPWLVPVAWCSRGITYLRRYKNALANGLDSARLGQQRMKLLKKYGIL